MALPAAPVVTKRDRGQLEGTGRGVFLWGKEVAPQGGEGGSRGR